MAKELPYFRFTPQEWQNGDISLERYELRGIFIEICSYYWVKDCSITKAMLEKRYSNEKALIDELVNLGILSFQESGDFIKISFLDDQFDTLSESRKRRQEAGSKGGKAKSSKAKAKLKQSSSYKDKDKDKDKDKEDMFFNAFKTITKKNIRVFDDKAKRHFHARLKEGYTVEDIIQAIENCKNDKYHIENPHYLTLEFITRADKLSKYLNSQDAKLTTPKDDLTEFTLKAPLGLTKKIRAKTLAEAKQMYANNCGALIEDIEQK